MLTYSAVTKHGPPRDWGKATADTFPSQVQGKFYGQCFHEPRAPGSTVSL